MKATVWIGRVAAVVSSVGLVCGFVWFRARAGAAVNAENSTGAPGTSATATRTAAGTGGGGWTYSGHAAVMPGSKSLSPIVPGLEVHVPLFDETARPSGVIVAPATQPPVLMSGSKYGVLVQWSQSEGLARDLFGAELAGATTPGNPPTAAPAPAPPAPAMISPSALTTEPLRERLLMSSSKSASFVLNPRQVGGLVRHVLGMDVTAGTSSTAPAAAPIETSPETTPHGLDVSVRRILSDDSLSGTAFFLNQPTSRPTTRPSTPFSLEP
jgi:hypothetical protein